MPDKGGFTHAKLARWRKTLSPAQLATQVLIMPDADDFGGTEYVAVTELVDLARENATISGGCEGPIMLVQELVRSPQGENV